MIESIPINTLDKVYFTSGMQVGIINDESIYVSA